MTTDKPDTPHFPDARIEAGRLVLRAFRPSDAARLREVIEAGDGPALPPSAPSDPGDLDGWLAGGVHEHRIRGGGLHLAIEERASGAHVGAISLYRTDWEVGAAEVGYGVRKAFRGRGHATEALRALTAWALADDRIQRVQLCAHVDNPASVRVAEKAGYVREGTLRRAVREDDGLHDLAVFARLDDD